MYIYIIHRYSNRHIKFHSTPTHPPPTGARAASWATWGATLRPVRWQGPMRRPAGTGSRALEIHRQILGHGFLPWGKPWENIWGIWTIYIYITYMTYVWCLEYERLVSFCSMFSWRMIFWWCCIIMVSSCGWYEMKHLSVKVGPHVEECQPLGHHQYECGMMMRSPFSSCGLLGVCELLGRPWIEIVFPMWPCVQSFRHNKILKSAVFVVTFKLFMQLIRSKPI